LIAQFVNLDAVETLKKIETGRGLNNKYFIEERKSPSPNQSLSPPRDEKQLRRKITIIHKKRYRNGQSSVKRSEIYRNFGSEHVTKTHTRMMSTMDQRSLAPKIVDFVSSPNSVMGFKPTNIFDHFRVQSDMNMQNDPIKKMEELRAKS
jgi:hypothetical protein